jgi:hypothetical protein
LYFITVDDNTDEGPSASYVASGLFEKFPAAALM